MTHLMRRSWAGSWVILVALAAWSGAAPSAPLTSVFQQYVDLTALAAPPPTGAGTAPPATAPRPAAATAPITAAPVGAEQTQAYARELAHAFPADQRARMQQVYVESLATYQQIEARLGIPANDVAGAIAAFIAGNYMAFRNAEVPDEHHQRLVAQVRESVASSGGVARASPEERRKLYEQMAMVGTFMAVAQTAFQQNPNPASEKNFRDAARANLETALKRPADNVSITAAGLVLR